MKATQKRVWSILFALMLLVSILGSVIALPVHAATVNYVYSGNYVYNWGQRDELATFLSPMAEDFYADNNVTYAKLSAFSGSSTISSVPDSALFDELHKLMYGNLVKATSYNDTRDLFKYTDCQNSGGSISSFYSAKAIGPSWDSGKTWNREHCWPNSKSNGGSDSNTLRETDIMMLRPTSVSENSSRSNTAYGEGSKFYDPNELGQNVRGDAARIVLYVYVCWGGSPNAHDGALNYMWGSSGVMESKEVLLKWMEEDPVDTWELGRNDAVEAITGTRNVFVDYPELAFELFNEDIPTDYDSPSGEGAGSACDHLYTSKVTTAATCGKDGVRTYTCSVCGHSYTEAILATGAHTYTNDCDGDCNGCGATRPTAGHVYTADCDAFCNVCGAERSTAAGGETTISFASTNDRISLSTSQQMWQSGDLTVTNNKANGSSNVADYSNPVRFYKGSQIVIAYPGMTSLVISAPTGSYGTPWAATLESAGLVYTVASGVYTVTFATPVDNITLTATAQIRANSITATAPGSAVDHTYDGACDADCNACGITRIPEDHVYTDAFDTACNGCGAVRQRDFGIFSDHVPNSRMEMDGGTGGLAFEFNASVSGVETESDYTSILDNAKVAIDGVEYKVIAIGAIVTNDEAMGTDPEQMIRENAGNSEQSVDIEAKYMTDVEEYNCTYAVRIINIPQIGFDNVVYARPYCIIEHNDKQITLYEDIVSATYNGR